MALTTPDQSTWTPADTGGLLAIAPEDAVVDNIFIYASAESDTGKVRRVIDGAYRASWAGIFSGGAAATNASRLNSVLDNADVNQVIFDTPEGGDIELSGTIDGQGKKITLSSSKLTGTYTIDDAVFDANPIDFILGGTPTITNSRSITGKWYPTWFGAIGDGVADDRTALNIANTVANANSQKIISLIPGNYLIGSNLSISLGVNLQFDFGSQISGAFTLSGSGTFEAGAYQVFGSTTVVSGLYPLNGVIYPQNFGAKGDNVTNDSPAIQRMFDFTNTLPTSPIEIFFPAKRYYHASTVNLPKGITQVVPVKITGYGATLRTNQNITVWQRMPDNNSEAYTIIDRYIGIIEGFEVIGDSTVSVPKTSQVGMKIGATYSWTFKNMHFVSLHNCLELQFALQCTVDNIRVTQQSNVGILGRHGTWTGANSFNTSFNANTIANCRVFSLDGAFCAYQFLSADQLMVDNCISEGQRAQYDIYYDWAGNTTVTNITFSNIWFEAASGTTYPKNTNFYISNPTLTHIIRPQRDYTDWFFELNMPTSSWQVIISGLQYIVGTPIFKYSNSAGGMIQINESRASLDAVFRNPSNWDNGTPLPFTFIGKGETGQDADAINGGKLYGINSIDNLTSTIVRSYSTNTGVPALIVRNPPSVTTEKPIFQGYLFNASINASLNTGLFHIFNNSAGNDRQRGYVNTNVGDASDNYPTFNFVRARGTVTTPTAVANGNFLGGAFFSGYTTQVTTAGYIMCAVDGTPGTTIPGRLRFYMRNSAGTMQEVFGLRASGALEIPVAPAVGAAADDILVRDSAGVVKTISQSLTASITGNTSVVIPSGRSVLQITTNSTSAQTGLNIGTTPGGAEIDSVTYGINDGSATGYNMWGNGTRSINFSNITGTVTYRIILA